MSVKKRDRSEYGRQWYAKNKERHKANNRLNFYLRRAKALDAYGNACICCGETEPDFLAFDHVHNDGAEHRKTLGGGGSKLYKWLEENNYPDTIQILCHNCNFSKHLNNGVCAHKETPIRPDEFYAETCKKHTPAVHRKLDADQVRYIRQNYKAGCRTFGGHALARKLGVTEGVVRNIINGSQYKDIT